MRAQGPIYCRELSNHLHVGMGMPENASRVLASLLVSGGTATLSEVAAGAGTSLGHADVWCSFLAGRGVVWRAPGMKPGTWADGHAGGLLRSLSRLRDAYRRGGLPAVREEHVRSVERSRAYRQTSSAIERVCPMRALLHLGAALEDALCRKTLPDAAASLLSRLPDGWEIPSLDAARPLLRRSPLVVFGNHPSMLTPFLLAAALDRDDLRILAHRYVTTLVPSMGPYVLPLEPTHLVSARRRGLSSPAHLLSLSALRRLDGVTDEDEARRANQTSLDEGVRHVVSGGRWYPGLGRLVGALRESEPLLVPVRETGSSNRRLHKLLHGRRRRGALREPVRLYVGEPIPIARLDLPADAGADEIAAMLQSVYERTAWSAIDRIASLRPRGHAERACLSADS